MLTGTHQWGIAIAQAVKRHLPKTLTLMGGAHPTFYPEVIQHDGLDMICRGEAEEAIVELAAAIQSGRPFDRIRNFWVKKDEGEIIQNGLRPLVDDLDSLPFLYRELYLRYPSIIHNQTQNFCASRGCPFDCTFCLDHQYKEMYRGLGRMVRLRSPRNVVDEVKDVASRMSLQHVDFIDDTFATNKKWLEEFSDLYRAEIQIPFTCNLRADLADERMVQRLAQARCRAVFFGIETGNEKLRTGVLGKRVTDEQILRLAAQLKANKIKFRNCNILGLPEETLEDAFSTVEMNIRTGPEFPWATIFVPYPGTVLAERCKQLGLLPPDFSPDDVVGTYHAVSSIDIPHAGEIENLHKFFQTAVLFPWAFPLIKRLIKLPPNVFLRLWFALVYGVVFMRNERRGLWWSLKLGWKNLRYLVPSFSGADSPGH
jgi:radical SAM superfamily enzyme YgiQ (UPF0313 family)